jgi:hypothetical protein
MKKILTLVPNGCLTPRNTGQLVVGRNITLALTSGLYTQQQSPDQLPSLNHNIAHVLTL